VSAIRTSIDTVWVPAATPEIDPGPSVNGPVGNDPDVAGTWPGLVE